VHYKNISAGVATVALLLTFSAVTIQAFDANYITPSMAANGDYYAPESSRGYIDAPEYVRFKSPTHAATDPGTHEIKIKLTAPL